MRDSYVKDGFFLKKINVVYIDDLNENILLFYIG